jgi:succinate dehydrogenase / fumarate reductase flavoprotein subunit
MTEIREAVGPGRDYLLPDIKFTLEPAAIDEKLPDITEFARTYPRRAYTEAAPVSLLTAHYVVGDPPNFERVRSSFYRGRRQPYAAGECACGVGC